MAQATMAILLVTAPMNPTLEDSVFCGSAERSYSGSIGVLSSTTNNTYGIYGMSGGADDFVAGKSSRVPTMQSLTPRVSLVSLSKSRILIYIKRRMDLEQLSRVGL